MEWKQIPSYPDYAVSNTGVVKRVTPYPKRGRRAEDGILKQKFSSGLKVTLYKDKTGTVISVARLVYEAFVGPIPVGFVIDHSNGNSRDNRVTNLTLIKRGGQIKRFFSDLRSTKSMPRYVESEEFPRISDPKKLRWRKIPGLEEYAASNFGEIRRRLEAPNALLNRTKLKYINPSGYYAVALSTAGRPRSTYTVHRLVALTFLEKPVTESKLVVNHKNGNKLDNRVTNLEWITHKENSIHAAKHGLSVHRRGEECLTSKLTWEQVRKIRKVYAKGQVSQTALGKKYGVHQSIISGIILNKTWREFSNDV